MASYPALGSLFEGFVKGYKDVSGIIRDAQSNEWHSEYMTAWKESRAKQKEAEDKAAGVKTTPIPDKAGPDTPPVPTPALTPPQPTATPAGSGSAPASAPASALPVDTRVIDPHNLINPLPPMVKGPTVAAPTTATPAVPASAVPTTMAPIPPEGSFGANAGGVGVGSALDVNNPPPPEPQQPWITNEAPRDIGAALRAFWANPQKWLHGAPPGGAPGYQTGGAGGVYPAPQQPFYRPPPPAMTVPGVVGGSQGQVLPDPESGIQHHTNRTALPVPAQSERPMRYDPATGQLVPW